jgi:hypothetical protein
MEATTIASLNGPTPDRCEAAANFARRGFVVLRGYLSAEQRVDVCRDFEAAPEIMRHEPDRGFAYSFRFAGEALIDALRPQLQQTGRALAGNVGGAIDLLVAAFYFDTAGSSFGLFHQDLDPYWLFGDPTRYVNVYIPILKPDVARSNLDLLPCDAVEPRLPAGWTSAPHQLEPCGDTYGARNLSTDATESVGFDVEPLVECPHLAEGDALVVRGDLLHRTQDAATRRVAISFRMVDPGLRVRRGALAAWGAARLRAVGRSARLLRALSCFDALKTDEVTARRIFEATLVDTDVTAAEQQVRAALAAAQSRT